MAIVSRTFGALALRILPDFAGLLAMSVFFWLVISGSELLDPGAAADAAAITVFEFLLIHAFLMFSAARSGFPILWISLPAYVLGGIWVAADLNTPWLGLAFIFHLGATLWAASHPLGSDDPDDPNGPMTFKVEGLPRSIRVDRSWAVTFLCFWLGIAMGPVGNDQLTGGAPGLEFVWMGFIFFVARSLTSLFSFLFGREIRLSDLIGNRESSNG